MQTSLERDGVSDRALFHGALLKSRRDVTYILYKHGGVYEDPSGRVTGRLTKEAGLASPSAATSILGAMESQGWIERDINGRRTYSIKLNVENPTVSRLVAHFESSKAEPEPKPEPIVLEVKTVESEPEDTSIVDAAAVADELLYRVVEILNKPAVNEDAQKRLSEQIEFAQSLRRQCDKLTQEVEELKSSMKAKDARIIALSRDNEVLESNLRAALRQERVHHGKGFRALEKFMQERPNGKR